MVNFLGGLFIDNGKIIGYILIDQKVKGWSKDPGPSTGEEVPRLFLFWEACLKELGLFIDESGDFGEYSHHSPYYIITMVFHNQEIDISKQIVHLDHELSFLGLNNICIHTGPIIRKEEIYKNMDIVEDAASSIK